MEQVRLKMMRSSDQPRSIRADDSEPSVSSRTSSAVFSVLLVLGECRVTARL